MYARRANGRTPSRPPRHADDAPHGHANAAHARDRQKEVCKRAFTKPRINEASTLGGRSHVERRTDDRAARHAAHGPRPRAGRAHRTKATPTRERTPTAQRTPTTDAVGPPGSNGDAPHRQTAELHIDFGGVF